MELAQKLLPEHRIHYPFPLPLYELHRSSATGCWSGVMSTVEAFQCPIGQLPHPQPAFILAELNDLLTAAEPGQFKLLPEPVIGGAFVSNYVAAMVEQAAYRKGSRPPAWTSRIAPLALPWFAVPWMSLRAHLLLESPVPFRRRNIFIDSTIGDRV